MERINLNVPADARKQLRAIARRRKTTEATVAREFVIAAIREDERQEFFRQCRETMTPALRERLLEIHRRFEEFDARSR